jgi:hypothetical protein
MKPDDDTQGTAVAGAKQPLNLLKQHIAMTDGIRMRGDDDIAKNLGPTISASL